MDKLRTYKLFKRKSEFEIYLDILPDRKQQKALTAFRISAHHLKIERGRYSGQKLEDRLCNICNVLEDEIHFFCDCSKYTDLRNKMFQNMAVLNSHSFESKKEQFIKLMASTDDTILKSIGLFLGESYRSNLNHFIAKLLERLNSGLAEEDADSYSVYTGMGGISYLYLHLFEQTDNKQYLETAMDYLKHFLRHLKGRKLSFLCGDAGPLALGAVIYHKLGNDTASKDCVRKLESLCQLVCDDPSMPDELLFGRVGYIYALLFVQQHLGEGKIDNSLVLKVVQRVIDSGKGMARHQKWRHPLMYAWHDKHYLGAAHGLAGIFYILMLIKDDLVKQQVHELVKPSIDFMLTLRFPSGNCPSSFGSDTDKLIHWCHGAPGWIHMFIQAYKVFNDSKYLEAARGCAEVIWQRGLLRKGYGVCHGVAGNGYAFLSMYQLTKDEKYLHRAYKFAEWCFDYGKHGCRRPDSPLSLFEGLAGTIYFLTDLLNPSAARFPAFQLHNYGD